MAGRLNLHEELCTLLGSRNVYYQPPESVKMIYPCIRYSKTTPNLKRANDKIYLNTNQYELTVIDYSDGGLPDRILNHFQMCSIDRTYISNNLYHTTLTIYY